MAQPAELLDPMTLAGDFDALCDEQDSRPYSMRKAIMVWVGLSAGAWGVIAAVVFAVA
jgi:hypothetical protein